MDDTQIPVPSDAQTRWLFPTTVHLFRTATIATNNVRAMWVMGRDDTFTYTTAGRRHYRRSSRLMVAARTTPMRCQRAAGAASGRVSAVEEVTHGAWALPRLMAAPSAAGPAPSEQEGALAAEAEQRYRQRDSRRWPPLRCLCAMAASQPRAPPRTVTLWKWRWWMCACPRS